MNYVSFIQDKSRTKVTKFEAGEYVFVPDPLAVMTKFEIQAAGGGGGVLPSEGAANYAGIMSGAGGGNFLSVIITEKIKLPSVRIFVGGVAQQPPSVDPEKGANGELGDHSYVGNSRVGAGGGCGVTAVNTTAAAVRTGSTGGSNTLKFDELGSWFELFRRDGGQGTSGYIPRYNDYGFIKGGNGGNSHWGVASRSDDALFSGSRNSYNSVSRDGYGYGFGACGRSYGNRTGVTGGLGGAGLTIVTEYF